MSKKIIHNKFPIGELSFEEIEDIHNTLQNGLGADYLVISTPTDISILEGDDILIKFEGSSYSVSEIIQAIEMIKRGTEYLEK